MNSSDSGVAASSSRLVVRLFSLRFPAIGDAGARRALGKRFPYFLAFFVLEDRVRRRRDAPAPAPRRLEGGLHESNLRDGWGLLSLLERKHFPA